MQRKVYLDFQDGGGFRDVSSLVKYDTLSITLRAFSENFHYAQNEATFDVIYNATIYALLRAATKDIIVKIINVYDVTTFLALESSGRLLTEDGFYLLTETGGFYPFFYGRIIPNKSRVYDGILANTIISLQAEDDTKLLDVPIGDIMYSNYTIMNPLSPSTSIVHQLAYLAGLTSAQISSLITIPTSFAKFAPNSPDDSILQVLDTLLFEYGYTLNFDANGVLSPIGWINTATSSYNFTESNMVRQVQISETARTFYGAEVTYYEIGTLLQTLLYRDSNCPYADTGGFSGYLIIAGTSYPPTTNVIDSTTGSGTIVYQEYDDTAAKYWTNKAVTQKLDYNYKAFPSDFSSILATENHYMDVHYDPGIVASTPIYYNTKAIVKYTNPTASGLNLYFNNIRGDIWYKTTERKSTIVNTTISGSSIDKYSSNFIYTKTDADYFVKHLAAIHDVGNVVYTLVHDVAVTNEVPRSPGEVVNITMDDGTNQNCIISERSYDETTQLYTYKIRSYAADIAAVNITSQTVSSAPLYMNLSDIVSSSLTPPNVQVKAALDGSSPDLTLAYTYMKILQGTMDMSPYWTYSATVSGVTGGFGTGANVNKYTVTGFVSDATTYGSVVITASRSGFNSQTQTFLLNKFSQSDAATSSGMIQLGIDLTAQIDQKIEAWYQETPDPADSWTTDALKQKHDDDQWYLTTSKIWKRYRYVTTNSGVWDLLQEQDALNAQAMATTASGIGVAAQNTANTKITFWADKATADASGVANDFYLASGLLYKWTSSTVYERITPKRWPDGTADPAAQTHEPLLIGDTFYNTSSLRWRVYSGLAWADDGPSLSATVAAYSPHYLGSYAYASAPATAHVDDTCLLWNDTSAQCGIYKWVTAWVKQTTPTTEMIGSAWADVMTVTNAGHPSDAADTAARVAVFVGSGVNFINVLGANLAFINQLFAQYIQVQTGGSIRGGTRYNADGTDNATSVSGFWLGANGQFKADKGSISAATISGGTINGTIMNTNTLNGGVINAATISGGTINGTTISGINGFIKNLKIGTDGSLIGGDRYDANGATVDGTKPGFFIGASGACKVAGIEFEGSQGGGVQWGHANSIGTPTAVPGVGWPALAAMNGSDVALASGGNDTLSYYRWNGGTFTLIGTPLTISGLLNVSMAALSSTRIALFNSGNSKLSCYEWTAGTSSWAIVGSALTITGAGVAQITALNGTDIALLDNTLDVLRTYSFGGSLWTQVGNSLTISNVDYNAIAALNATTVIGQGPSGALHVYIWDGANWTDSGATYSPSPNYWPAMAGLNGTDIVYFDSTYDLLRIYRWDGSAIARISDAGFTPISGVTYPAMAAINGTDIVFIGSGDDNLRMYRFQFCISKPFSRTLTN